MIPAGTDHHKLYCRTATDVGGNPPRLVINLSVHLLIPVPISPRVLDGIEQLVRRRPARLGGFVNRWLALIAMLGLLALVIATSRIPCVPYGLWPILQMHCK
jgi:hypothetical protein